MDDNQKPDFENDDLNLLMEEEIRASLKQRDLKRKQEKIAIKIVFSILLIGFVAFLLLIKGCFNFVNNYKIKPPIQTQEPR